MHPPNHGIKHQLIMTDSDMLTGYPTFDTINIVEFNAYGQKRVNHNSRATLYHPITLIYDDGHKPMRTAVVYKSDRFKLIY